MSRQENLVILLECRAMLKPFPFVLLLAIAALPCLAFAYEEGKQAPVFSATLLDGTAVNNQSVKGHVTILHFWATWCESCQHELPALDKYYREHRDSGLQVIAISLDDTKDDAVVQKVTQALALPVAYDRNTEHSAYGRVWVMPMTFVIDRDGILRKDGSAHPWIMNAESLDKFVTPLLLKSELKTLSP